MSHLSILPTVLRDADLLAASLQALGLEPQSGGMLRGFADDRRKVVLQVKLPEGHSIGWARQADGSLALVGDLQRLSRSRSLQSLLGRLTRHYAAQQALRDASRDLQGATVHIESSLVV
ncbi:DUF1257 domain-containing protein [Synechococcus sp. FGCU-3]|nr:DUF1257 domain-containing protein [Synechococcus sp. FGCU3]